MFHELWHLMTNPAHLMFEVLSDIVFDVLLLGLAWPLVQRRLRREHEVIDAEHGVDHHLAAPKQVHHPHCLVNHTDGDDDERICTCDAYASSTRRS